MPPTPEPVPRTAVQVRMTLDDWRTISRAADRAGLSIPRWMLTVSLKAAALEAAARRMAMTPQA